MRVRSRPLVGIFALFAAGALGCHQTQHAMVIPPSGQPHELAKINQGDYVIEAPDILQIDVLHAIPLPPYKIKPLDSIVLIGRDVVPEEPINGVYPIDMEGRVNLQFNYGAVQVAGMTLEEAKAAIEKHLKDKLKLTKPVVEVSVGETRAQQQVRGPHLVRPDGRISLGIYGEVQVGGLTLKDAKAAIEIQLMKFLQAPEVTVDVAAFNSKVYYVIQDGGGAGQQIIRLPLTGSETVLDAISQVNGLIPVADINQIQLARRTTIEKPDEVYPVDWVAITTLGKSDTNYQLMAGDRIFVQSDHWVFADTRLARVFAPIERVLGISLLGASAYRQLRFINRFNGGNGGNFNP